MQCRSMVEVGRNESDTSLETPEIIKEWNFSTTIHFLHEEGRLVRRTVPVDGQQLVEVMARPRSKVTSIAKG